MQKEKISANVTEELTNIASFIDRHWPMLQKIPLQEELLFRESAQGRFVTTKIECVDGLREERPESGEHHKVYWHLTTPTKLNFHGTKHRHMSDELAKNFLVTLREKLFPVIHEMEKRQREENEKSAVNSVIDQIAKGTARNYSYS